MYTMIGCVSFLYVVKNHNTGKSVNEFFSVSIVTEVYETKLDVLRAYNSHIGTQMEGHVQNLSTKYKTDDIKVNMITSHYTEILEQ